MTAFDTLLDTFEADLDAAIASGPLPEPVTTFPRQAYADMQGRVAKITYVVSEPTPEQDGGSVIVTVSHNKDRKAFVVSIQPVAVTVPSASGFHSQKFLGFSGVTVARKPVARFSKKDFAAFVAETPAAIEKIVAADADIAAMFTDPVAASQRMFRA